VDAAIEGRANAADATDPLGLGRQPVRHLTEVGQDHHRERFPVFPRSGRHRPADWPNAGNSAGAGAILLLIAGRVFAAQFRDHRLSMRPVSSTWFSMQLCFCATCRCLPSSG
jgi:hypothetical protein